MKILVIGGHGFVGRNIIKIFANTDHDVIALSRQDGLDLLEIDSIKSFISDNNPDYIINVAAKVGSLNYVTQQAADIFDINMRMLLNLYKSVQEIGAGATLIHPIANCGYPGNMNIYREDEFWNGEIHQSVLAYGNTRRMIDILSQCYSMQYGLNCVNFIVPNMYGPYDSTDPNKAHALNAIISKIVKAQKKNEKEFIVWGSGIAIREWLYAEDFGRTLKIYIESDMKAGFHEPFNVGQNFGMSIRELLDLIIKYSGYKGKIIWDKDMPDGAPRKVMDDTRFRKLYPDFNFTELEFGIKQTIKYYQDEFPY